MANRDYFKKPIQSGGRSAHDYGHTRLGEPVRAPGAEIPGWVWGGSAAAFVGGILYLLPEVV